MKENNRPLVRNRITDLLKNKIQSGVLILGCGKELAERIRAQSEIEFIELEPDDEYFDFGN